MSHAFIRPVAGLATVVLIAALVGVSAILFRGSRSPSVAVAQYDPHRSLSRLRRPALPAAESSDWDARPSRGRICCPF